jgi:hypothetical protein
MSTVYFNDVRFQWVTLYIVNRLHSVNEVQIFEVLNYVLVVVLV